MKIIIQSFVSLKLGFVTRFIYFFLDFYLQQLIVKFLKVFCLLAVVVCVHVYVGHQYLCSVLAWQ